MKKYYNYLPAQLYDKPVVKTYVIDLFAGAGGTSTAIYESRTNIQVIACINHDANAIRSHSENYPDCIHYTEDIRTVSLLDLKRLVDHLRLEDPTCLIAIWASLECTHFSKAKGGQSRDADSRTLAEHLFRYDDIIKPDFFWIENVREFLTWGPLGEDNKPIKELKGVDYRAWVKQFEGRGYTYDYRIINAADQGAFTSRVRYFGQFSKNPDMIAWPTQTHFRKPAAGQQGWQAVRKVLNLTDEGTSIFHRKKRLSDATLRRIYAGLIKFVANGDETFIKKYFSGDPSTHVIGMNGPAGTITCKDHHAIVKVDTFIKRYNGGNPEEKVKSIDTAIGTIATNNRHAVVKCDFLCSYYKNSTFVGENEPCGTLTTKDRFQKVNVNFIQNYYSSGGEHCDLHQPCPTLLAIPKQRVMTVNFLTDFYSNGTSHPVENPCPTLLTKDKFAKTTVTMIDNQYGQSNPTSPDQPIGSITANPKQNVITAEPWIMDTQFGNTGQNLDKPMNTITANRKYHYLMNPQYASKGGSILDPCFTLIARMDKSPPYFITTENSEEFSLDLSKFFDELDAYTLHDSLNNVFGPLPEKSIRVKIVEFMIAYGIKDIKMRMLQIIEMLQIQGFPKDYILRGTQTEQKKYIGNSVEVTVGVSLFQAIDKQILKVYQTEKLLSA